MTPETVTLNVCQNLITVFRPGKSLLSEVGRAGGPSEYLTELLLENNLEFKTFYDMFHAEAAKHGVQLTKKEDPRAPALKTTAKAAPKPKTSGSAGKSTGAGFWAAA